MCISPTQVDCFICGIHGFGFASDFPSRHWRYQIVVPSPAHTHRILGRGVRHCTQVPAASALSDRPFM